MQSIKSFNSFVLPILEREKRDVSNFSEKDMETIDDLFLKYSDEYNMREMISETSYLEDEGKYQQFDINNPTIIQYSIRRYKNVGIEICLPITNYNESFRGNLINYLKRDFKRRLIPFGMDIFQISRSNTMYIGNIETIDISITIFKID